MVEGARKAKGLAVIIDVFRAFSVEAYAFGKGVDKIYPVGNLDEAFQIAKSMPGSILLGERKEQMVEGFDFGNSPMAIMHEDLEGKTMVHTTSAGTQGIVNAKQADEIITGSFVNAGAIIRYIQAKNPKNVSLVCMGYSAKQETEEDSLCAEYLHDSILGKEPNFEQMVETIRQTSGRRFFDPAKAKHNPTEDFYLCLSLNKFDFIIRAESDPIGRLVNIKVPVQNLRNLEN